MLVLFLAADGRRCGILQHCDRLTGVVNKPRWLGYNWQLWFFLWLNTIKNKASHKHNKGLFISVSANVTSKHRRHLMSWVDQPNICSFALLAAWQKTTYVSSWEVSEKIYYCLITSKLARLAGCQFSGWHLRTGFSILKAISSMF